jgi:hypothetical protein
MHHAIRAFYGRNIFVTAHMTSPALSVLDKPSATGKERASGEGH